MGRKDLESVLLESVGGTEEEWLIAGHNEHSTDSRTPDGHKFLADGPSLMSQHDEHLLPLGLPSGKKGTTCTGLS